MDASKHLPNLLSGLRIALVPVLLWLAWTERPTAFLVTFAFSLSTDLLDGYLARRMNTGSLLGAKLDSWGDLATYAVFPLCAWWAFHESVVAQLPFVFAGLVAFVTPTLIGLVKFRRITSYHTRLAKAVAIVMGLGLILYLGFDVPWFFQVAVLFLLVEALEEIAITAVLPEWRANVPSIFAALEIARTAKPAVVLALALLAAPVTASAQELPDMRPMVSGVRIELDQNVDAGDVTEGCAPAATHRDLVRLDLITRNDGPGPVTVGDPMCPNCSLPENQNEQCGNPDFICSPSGGHNHPHYQNFLRYEIVDENQVVVATGGKRSFCLAESSCDPGHSPPSYHTCSNQGLHPFCEDLYPYWLGCQYVDVTEVPDGVYSLRVTVDPMNRFAEDDETNNEISVPVELLREPTGDELLDGASLYLKAEHVLRVSAKAPDGLPLHGTKADPTTGGATLYVFDMGTGGGIGFGLPAEGWKRMGKGAIPRGWRYKGAGTDLDACLSVEVTAKGMRARCKLDGEHTHFDLPVEGKVNVQLLLGVSERRLCASFGGREQRNDAVLVKRKNSDPAGCDDQ